MRYSWKEGQSITRLKSRFKGWAIPIERESDVKVAISRLLEDHKVAKASHPAMYAWKTAKSNTITSKVTMNEVYRLNKLDDLRIGWHDDKEGGSGMRLMGLLDRMRLVNVLVAVTRWYGGTPLGPARFRCISDAATDALAQGGYSGAKKGWIDVAMLENTASTTTNSNKH